MEKEGIEELWNRYREPGFGTMSVADLVSIEGLISQHKPRSFLEIGTASGLSAAIIAHMLQEHGGVQLMTVDLLHHFYGDKSKEAGFVIPLAYPDGTVHVDRRTGWTAIDVVDAGQSFDMALVDGGHVHPWPLIDTLCVNTVLTGSRIVIQDDLTLFRRRPNGRGVGPKFLFDQFPESHRNQFSSGGGNLFTVSLDLPASKLEKIALDAFALPWTLFREIPEPTVEKFMSILRTHYSSELADGFAQHCAQFNKPNGRYFRGGSGS